MQVDISPELAQQGVKVTPLKGLYSPPMGYFLKPCGEIGLLPADASKQDYYKFKGFEFLGFKGDVDLDKLNDKLKREKTRQQKKNSKGGKV